MNKYNNPRLTNTTIAGSGMKHPVRPHVIIGDPKNGYIQGDLMDANAVKEIAKESVNDIVDGAPEALDTLKELADAIQENGAADLVTKGLLETALTDKVDKSDIAEGDANGHEYVDLGLPSGTLWATMNVGATSETDYGNYYMYGMGSKTYDSTDTPYAGTEDPLATSADTASQVWGGSWHMPTRAQMQELTANTTYEWTTINGVNGGKFTATNGNYVFFPAAGIWDNGSQIDIGSYSNYWSSSPNGSNNAYSLYFYNGGEGVSGNDRKVGYSVRPVLNLSPKYATKAEVEQLQSSIVQSDWNQNDSTAIDYIKNKPDLSKYVEQSDMVESDANGHDYVEIGGIKWATMNIGANNIQDAGLYFQWGDTQGYTADLVGSGEGQKYFGWADYKYGNGTSSPGAADMTKYNATDGKTVLEAADDAAAVNWGGGWRMPTTAEFQTLGAAVNTAWTQVNNVYGILCTDKTDSSKTLFFPTAGYCRDGSVNIDGMLSDGCYWSSSLITSNSKRASRLYFSSGSVGWGSFKDRFFGFPVRGVLDGEDKYATKAEVKQLQSNLEARVAALEQAAQS